MPDDPRERGDESRSAAHNRDDGPANAERVEAPDPTTKPGDGGAGAADDPGDLSRLRNEIDEINRQLLDLLNRRARVALEVGERKRRRAAARLTTDAFAPETSIYVPSRESQIFEWLAQANAGPLDDEAVAAVFREVISQCRALEEPMQVAYGGMQGSHAHLAALSRFGTAAEFVPVASIAGVFDRVEKRLSHYGVVPAGNNVEGVMARTLDLLAQRDPRICAEVYQPLSYDLLSRRRRLEEVRRIYASSQPLALCSGWIDQYLPDREIVETPATSRALRACREDPEGAAIANPLNAEHTGLTILQAHIEDDPRSKGRFFVIGFNEPQRSGRDKTSILLSLHHKPGAMVRALDVLSRHHVNLTFVQSRHALHQPNVYRLFIDIQGFVEDEAIAGALAEMTREEILFEILGSYPDALPSRDEPTD